MIIDAACMESWEGCRRRWTWQQNHELIRVTPMGALYRAIDQYLTADKVEPDVIKAWIMTEAGERGIWSKRQDTYDMMTNYAHLAECVARILRQPSAGPIEKHRPIEIAKRMEWQPNSYLIDNGLRIMRVVLVDHWDEDRQASELHSWRTVGDVCTTELPMTLRVIVIGHNREGRRHSAWTKGQQHPVNRQLRFARKHGKADGLAASWKTVWREECGINAQAWLEQMSRDGVLRELAFDRPVKVPGPIQRQRVIDDISAAYREMLNYVGASGSVLPRTRSACHSHGEECAFQCCCFAPGLHEIEPLDTGVFRRRR